MKAKIMVIDDEELLTRTFARMLERQDYEVWVASRPEDALAMAEKEDFDLVLCDIRMPGKNGVETIREIQSQRLANQRGRLPVIFLTGYADIKLEKEAETLEPVAYIFKPFDTGKLLELIRSTVKN